MKTIIKKILSCVTACFISVTMLFNLSASAAFTPAAPVAIPILQEVLMGIGAVLVSAGILHQSDISGLTNTELQETVTHAMERPENLDKLRESIGDRANNPDLEEKINNLANSTVGNPINPATNLYNPFINLVASWINNHYDNIKTETVDGDYPNIDGAKSILFQDHGNNAYTVYYSKVPGKIFNRTSTSFSYTIDFFCKVVKNRDGTSEVNYFDNSSGGTYYFNKTSFRFIGEWIDINNNTELEISEDIAGEEQALPIGSVDIDGVEYPVTADGVQIGDNVYPISNDGTIIVEGNTYKPTYYINNFDDSAIIDLLLDISKKIETLSLPSDDESVDDIVNNAVISIPEDLTKLNLKSGIASVFPFCIPFDFVRGLKLLAVQPEAPRFEVPFVLPEFGSFPGVDEKIVVDFADYTSYFDVVRWGNYVIFLFGLCFITFKLVKGA